MGRCEWLCTRVALCLENSAVMSFGFYMKMKNPGALWGGKGTSRVSITV